MRVCLCPFGLAVPGCGGGRHFPDYDPVEYLDRLLAGKGMVRERVADERLDQDYWAEDIEVWHIRRRTRQPGEALGGGQPEAEAVGPDGRNDRHSGQQDRHVSLRFVPSVLSATARPSAHTVLLLLLLLLLLPLCLSVCLPQSPPPTRPFDRSVPLGGFSLIATLSCHAAARPGHMHTCSPLLCCAAVAPRPVKPCLPPSR